VRKELAAELARPMSAMASIVTEAESMASNLMVVLTFELVYFVDWWF
jgi:hypothetical protein